MPVRATRVRRAIAVLAAATLLPAGLLAATPSAASAASCTLQVNNPWLSSDGWAVYINGSGSAFCNSPVSVEMLIREDVSGWFDRTVTAGYGTSGQYIQRTAPCWGPGWRNYYVEVRANGQEAQSQRVAVNGDCG